MANGTRNIRPVQPESAPKPPKPDETAKGSLGGSGAEFARDPIAEILKGRLGVDKMKSYILSITTRKSEILRLSHCDFFLYVRATSSS
jgi:hypothetical protein